MIALPSDIPVVKDLNSYYLHIEKFLEHYQGFISAGAIHFSSPATSGVIFFDEYRFLNAEYIDKTEYFTGVQAFRKLIQTASLKNFSVSVFEIDMDSIYYWVHTSSAKEVYKDLKPEFKNIYSLIEKMKSEKLTGYIHIEYNGVKDQGNIFFNNGIIIAAHKKISKLPSGNVTDINDVIKKADDKGGSFSIFQIQLNQKLEEIVFTPSESRQSRPDGVTHKKTGVKNNIPDVRDEVKKVESIDYLIEMLQLLLQMLEKTVRSNKKIKADFDTLLKKIFVEKVDRYDFLDPFAAELTYENGRLRFYGRVKDKDLVSGIVECAMDLAETTGIYGLLVKNLAPWIKKYENELNKFNIKF